MPQSVLEPVDPPPDVPSELVTAYGTSFREQIERLKRSESQSASSVTQTDTVYSGYSLQVPNVWGKRDTAVFSAMREILKLPPTEGNSQIEETEEEEHIPRYYPQAATWIKEPAIEHVDNSEMEQDTPDLEDEVVPDSEDEREQKRAAAAVYAQTSPIPKTEREKQARRNLEIQFAEADRAWRDAVWSLANAKVDRNHAERKLDLVMFGPSRDSATRCAYAEENGNSDACKNAVSTWHKSALAVLGGEVDVSEKEKKKRYLFSELQANGWWPYFDL